MWLFRQRAFQQFHRGSFYVRRRIGQRAWRLLHYTTLLAFAFATTHGVMSGTDTPAAWAFWIYATASVSVVFLLGYRITLALVGAERGRKELAP